jgi:hypothetical protein
LNPDYVEENARERERLIRLTERLTESDLARAMPNGWSVATKLAHLAFWDRYYFALIEEWERAGYRADTTDAHAVNDAARFLSSAISPAAVPRLVVTAAEAIDRRLEAISPELEAELESDGRIRVLRRALHRREHLDQIEDALR